jgi:biotin transport system substrate-specific component
VIGIGRSGRSQASAAVLAATATKQLSVLHTVAGTVAFAALTFLGAHIYVPLQPVPITMQTLFVLLAGAAVGGRIGGFSQLLYVGIGAAGLPVVIFVMGVSHLAAVYTHDLVSALRFGLLPFVPGALVKIAAAVCIYRAGAAFSVGIRARTAKRSA